MAAIDLPGLSSVGSLMSVRDDGIAPSSSAYDAQGSTGLPPTFAAFSPVTLSASTPSRSPRRSTILVHQKSPLLLATPPQVTRALAYSHPFILLLNELAGLLTWSSSDPWQSFLLLSAFWAVCLYGDVVVRRAGPVLVGLLFIAGMYGRRFSPLSSSGWGEPGSHPKEGAGSKSSTATVSSSGKAKASSNSAATKANRTLADKNQKTLDDIVDTLKEFTGRCNVLIEPLLEMTDFLSTQLTPTSATTKPALTAMFIRLLVVTPFWFALALPPWRVITTRRVVLVAGTLALTWHARVMRVSRTILWRSATVRRLAAAITGLSFDRPNKGPKPRLAPGLAVDADNPKAATQVRELRTAGVKSPGVKFTFSVFENQRRWVGLGWTSSLFAYERPAWADEHNNSAPPKDDFELPDVEDGSHMRWRWAPGSRWRVDGVSDDRETVDYDGEEGKNGWVYYDNKWQFGRRGQDGWGKWTRRRKWYRDAELIEVDPAEVASERARASSPAGGPHTQRYSTAGEKMVTSLRAEADQDDGSVKAADDAASIHSTSSRSSFWPGSLRKRATERSRTSAEKERLRRSEVPAEAVGDDSASGLGLEVELELQKQGKDGGQWGIGDEARMNLE
ncbi:hypothetical protein CDD80_261 [Ophiocordyceps camponoti-rufipedis]|uniref:Peroxin/Ferlin domain-containing protein n=1 Tax=Ophiocordyceps camponoti-rufipedis TaxID=2004952 RepID=A0A2C5Z9Q1_9HYPO|nr:hypothetical protein CDD80_261 [Ophiocordyceps camponoti-rufipedis]